MRRAGHILFRVLLVVVAAIAPLTARQIGSVRITAARASLRSEPKDTGPVVAQLAVGTVLTLRGEDGDWFRVEYVDARLGPVRVEAYVSKKMAVKVAAPAATPPAASPAPQTKLTASLQTGTATTPLTLEWAKVRLVDARVDPERALAGMLPLGDVSSPDGAAAVTVVWALAAGTPRVVTDVRPSFVADFKNVSGLAVDTVAPVLIRIAPALSGARVVAATRGRADLVSRTTEDWDPMKDFKQDVVRAVITTLERGFVRLVPAADLEPGEYAIVLRPKGRVLVSGAAALSSSGAGEVFAGVWRIAVKPAR